MSQRKSRFLRGAWVKLTASGPLHGVVVEDSPDGTVLIQVAVGEWMLALADPDSADGPDQD